jgi:hypothetical protein
MENEEDELLEIIEQSENPMETATYLLEELLKLAQPS